MAKRREERKMEMVDGVEIKAKSGGKVEDSLIYNICREEVVK